MITETIAKHLRNYLKKSTLAGRAAEKGRSGSFIAECREDAEEAIRLARKAGWTGEVYTVAAQLRAAGY